MKKDRLCFYIGLGCLLVPLLLFSFLFRELKIGVNSTIEDSKKEIDHHLGSLLNIAVTDVEQLGENQFRLSLKEELRFLIKLNPIYSQLRIVSMEGKEEFRLNQREGKVYETPVEGLQDKSNRYYHREFLKTPDKIYISKLDYNVEFGKEEKGVLTFRVAKKVSKERYLIFNIDSSIIEREVAFHGLNLAFREIEQRPSIWMSILRGRGAFPFKIQPTTEYDDVNTPNGWNLVLEKDLSSERRLFQFYFFTFIALNMLGIFFLFSGYLRKSESDEIDKLIKHLLDEKISYFVEDSKGNLIRYNSRLLSELETDYETLEHYGVNYFEPKYSSSTHPLPMESYMVRGERWEGVVHLKSPNGRSVTLKSVRVPLMKGEGVLKGIATLTMKPYTLF